MQLIGIELNLITIEKLQVKLEPSWLPYYTQTPNNSAK